MIDYFIAAGLSVAVCFAAWYVLSVWKKRYDFVDLAWGNGFIVLAAALLFQNSSHVSFAQKLVTALVIVWGVRLCVHVAWRIWGKSEDKRYAKARKTWPQPHWFQALVRVYLIRAILLIAVGLPLIAVASATTVFNSDYVLLLGFDIWLAGFFVEAFADSQLAQFRRGKKKEAIFMDGLWKYSRHPNYFGEVLMWWGIWVISLSIHTVWWSAIGPLAITLLLFASVMPAIEKRYAKDKNYHQYARVTSKFIPWPPKKARQ